jgi:hypothetical protein
VLLSTSCLLHHVTEENTEWDEKSRKKKKKKAFNALRKRQDTGN